MGVNGHHDHLLVAGKPTSPATVAGSRCAWHRHGYMLGSVADTTELSRDEWRPYFDELSRTLATTRATVEIDAPDLGAQLQADEMVLSGISYDDRDDILVIGLSPGGPDESLEHFVSSPRSIVVEGSEGIVPAAIEAVDGEGQRTIVRLEAAPTLPAA